MSKKLKKRLIRILIALTAFIILFVLDKIFVLATVIPGQYGWLLAFALYLSIYLYIGYDILYKAARNIAHGQLLDENFLMCIATIGAFALAIFRALNNMEVEGFDEACAVLLFYQVGEWFQAYAVGKSRKDISSLMDIRPDYANVYKDGVLEEMVDPSEVNVDDVILVKPGEKVPLDGVVVKGMTTLDTKALTGEAIPLEVGEGANVISGSVNMSSTIEIKVKKAFYDSTVSKILDLVENASSQKSRAENFITKFSKYYTPIVVISAFLLALIPSIITKNPAVWIYRALTFLVVSCPCALVISIPLTFFAGIGGASKNGILVKGSNYLEMYNKANIFVFDKTGTLTKGNFVVTKVFPEDKKDEILHYAAIAESGSNHPIAKSIVACYGKKIDTDYVIEDVQGFGIVAKGESTIICGNEKLMKQRNIEYVQCEGVGTCVYVAKDDEYLGYILISDEIKKESKITISELNKLNAKTIMLTGDNETIAKSVANEIGLTQYKASLLPQNKVEEVEALLNNKKKDDVLCFVGDGINDAPVLMRSDIGIAMGGVGSDAAIEASDIVLMNDNISDLIKAKKVCKRTMRIVHENIYFALGVKALILILTALGIFGSIGMWMAIFGDVGVAFIAIINAMRANKKINN